MSIKIDFNQIEKHVDSSVCALREIQGAGKYPKKVCNAAMYGANMLGAQKNIISELRSDTEKLHEFAKRMINDITGHESDQRKHHWNQELDKLLGKQED